MIELPKTKPKKYLISPAKNMEMKSLANLTGIPDEIVTDAYLKSFMNGMKPFDILQPYVAQYEADKEGREYTPIFWHRTEDGVLHLTMWDMNERPSDGISLNPMAFTYGANTAP